MKGKNVIRNEKKLYWSENEQIKNKMIYQMKWEKDRKYNEKTQTWIKKIKEDEKWWWWW